jgi:hypothetical protein
MKSKKRIVLGIVVIASALLMATAVAAPAARSSAGGPDGSTGIAASSLVGTGFTYQGQLKDGGQPVNDDCEMAFRLYDAALGGDQVGSAITATVPISDGVFTVGLDFGAVFTGTARWLGIAVQCPGDAGFAILSPRQALTPVPYALALPGLWTQQNGTSPNLIGGYGGNWVADGVVAATIGGGGELGFPNRVTGHFGTVAGGVNNAATADNATVGGGDDNQANGPYAVVAGGYLNRADHEYATIGGGLNNNAGGFVATVGGGGGNVATGLAATVAGGGWITATGDFAAVGGGHHNAACGTGATVDGGEYNAANNNYTAIGGGITNTVDSAWATIGGGISNTVTGGAPQATIGGGHANVADGVNATVGGGQDNTAGDLNTTVAGGYHNVSSGESAAIGGGNNNTAGGAWATVSGGDWNTASGDYATVGGGQGNAAAGDYSFAAGRRAKANHAGAFVWGDSTDVDVPSPSADSFTVRASGGITMHTSSDLISGATLPAGSGSWVSLSDRDAKENLAPVEGEEVLARLAGVPISTWNYKTQDPTIRHMGPMAQDLYAAFGLGESERHISTIDADGLALVSIQALYRRSQDQATRIERLEAEVSSYKEEKADLEARVAALEAALVGGPAPSQVPQSSLLPWAGVLLAGVGLAWAFRRRDIVGSLGGGER